MTAQPRGGDGSIGYTGPGQGGTKLVLVEEGRGGGGGERHLCVAGSENGLVFCLLQRLPPSECLLGTRPLVDPAVFICMTAPRKTREFRLPKNVPRSAAEHVLPTSFPACRVCPTRRVFKAGVRCGACVGPALGAVAGVFRALCRANVRAPPVAQRNESGQHSLRASRACGTRMKASVRDEPKKATRSGC